jgi:glyoxylase-like metal-dependent hydrolase (beta-lactamase superfamily II)
MDRRRFFSLSGVSLAAVCGTGWAQTVSKENTVKKNSPAEGRFYPAVVQTDPLGRKVVHDRQTYIEQYKYDNWEAGRSWDDDAGLWRDFSRQWGKLSLPIQHRPMQILEGLYLIGPADYQQNIYLWDTGDGLLIVDSSYESFRPMLEIQIRQLGYDPSQVKWIVLTHGHNDHAENSIVFLKKGAEVYLCAVEDGVKEAQASGDPDIAARLKVFKDGDELSFGALRLKVILTPGHTSGSCCFSTSWQGTGILISGDHVLHFGRYADMSAPICDWDRYLASLWKVYDHPDAKNWQMLFPGHSTIDLERARDGVYQVLQVTSEVMRRRRAGEKIDWLNSYEYFWQCKLAGKPAPDPLKS